MLSRAPGNQVAPGNRDRSSTTAVYGAEARMPRKSQAAAQKAGISSTDQR